MNFIEFCKHQHDVVCNQKYNDTLPYSFHLNLVAEQAKKWKYLIKDEYIENPQNCFSDDEKLFDIVLYGAWGHDLIEDARVTYNDIKNTNYLGNIVASTLLADIIYACTELRGKNRDERHGHEYIQGLKENKLGLFVKLCDISANIGFGILTNSTMVDKYRKEFPKFKEQLYLEEYKPIFDYIEKQLEL
jgi:hypothetical protein